MKDLMRFKELQRILPAEYWETEGAIYGAIVDKVSPDGLLMLSIRDMPVGTRLNVRIFYAHEFELEGFTVVAKIVWKSVYTEENWRGYKYGLDCVQLSEQKLPRLNNLGGRSGLGVIMEGKEVTLDCGDSAYLDPSYKHGYRRIGSDPCTAIVVTVP